MSAQSHVIGQNMEGGVRFVVLSHETGIRKDRLRLTRPVKKTQTINKVKTVRYTSDFYYVDDANKNCKPPTTIWTTQQAWTSMSFPYMSDESTHQEENCIGFKTAYPLQKEVETLTPPEKFTQSCSKIIYDEVYSSLVTFKDDLPEDCFDIYEKAEKRKDRSLAVRPLFNFRNKSVDDKTPDITKSQVMYIDFSVYAPKDETTKKALTGRALKCNTEITGPGNKPMSPFDICGKPGFIQVVIEWLGVNWLPNNSKMAAIIKYKLNQITWKPAGAVSVPRLLSNLDVPESEDQEEGNDAGPSTSGVVDDDNSGSSGDDNLDDDFDDPTGKKPAKVEEPEPEPAPAPVKKMSAAERRAAVQKSKAK